MGFFFLYLYVKHLTRILCVNCKTVRLKECMTQIESVLTVCLFVIQSDLNNSPSHD